MKMVMVMMMMMMLISMGGTKNLITKISGLTWHGKIGFFGPIYVPSDELACSVFL